MNIVKASKLSIFIAALGVIGLLAACGGGLSGKYVSATGNSSLTFQSGNKVLIQSEGSGASLQKTYTVADSPAGKKITLKNSDGTLYGILILRPNGCLVGSGKYCKP